MSRRLGTGPFDPDELVAELGGALSISEMGQRLTTLLADRLGIPAALLSQDRGTWRFEAEAWPNTELLPPKPSGSVSNPLDGEGQRWTGIALAGERALREWMLLVPGVPDNWHDSSVVSDLAPSIGALLDDVAEREEIEHWKRFGWRYHAFCRRLMRAQTTEDLHRLVLRSMAAQLRAGTGVLALYNDEQHHLEIAATLGYPREIVEHLRIKPGEGVLGSVFGTGRPALVSAPHEGARRLRYRTDSYVAVPLVGGAGVLGVAAFTDRADQATFTGADLAVLRLLASPAALALSIHQFRRAADEGTRLASIDPLTGLFNRRYFDSRLEAELQRARRHGEPLALLMVDIDDFKVINDEHGHVTGDRLLRCVADRLRRGVRIFDVCARYGGDEFAILMPSSTIDTATLVADRIRTAVRSHCLQGSRRITLSIGIALSDGRERDLLSIADRALLDAKAAGKNTVRVYHGR